MWTNLGYWPGAHSYGDAARALACRVGHAAHLRACDIVLDYACGYGDSLRLWIEEFGVARVIGVEPDPAVVARVQQRIAGWGLSERITMIAARAEELMPSELVPRPTAVVCVDAAYHFESRRAWLARVINALPPHGRLGIADLVFSPKAATSWRINKLAQLTHIPAKNFETAAQMEDAILDAGAQIAWSECAGEGVLDGFAASSFGRGFPLMVTRQMVKLARKGRLVDYRVIGAERGAPAPAAPSESA
jgi:cyclopropane fatty-acyl-phospholipid synthase-like methyltransferase